MFLDYPLQQTARLRGEPFQLAFARRAKSIIGNRDDCVPRDTARGLTLLARHEQALEMPISVLREVFGGSLEIGPPEVRLAGEPPQEPIMHVRVNAPAARIDAVRNVLLDRGVTLLEESRGKTRWVLRGEAPLRLLLGIGPQLDRASLGSALLWAALTRYEPCPTEPVAA